MLQCAKAELKDLSCRDDDNAVLYLQNYDVGKVHMMVHYQSHLSTNGHFPEDIETFRFHSITRKDYVYFVRHPDDIALVSSTHDITTTLPANSGLHTTSKSLTLQLNPSKILSKETQAFLLLLRKVNIGSLGAETPSPLLEHRT